MKTTGFLLLTLLIFPKSIHAQQKTATLPDTIRHQLTLLPLAFMDVDGGLQLGYNYRIRPTVSLQADLGYLFYETYGSSLLQSSGGNKVIKGYSFKTELKMYMWPGSDLSGLYWAPQLFIKKVTYPGIYDYSDEGAHPEKLVYGSHLKIGYSSGRSFISDIYLGLGIRGRQVQGSGTGYTSQALMPSATLGIRLGVGL